MRSLKACDGAAVTDAVSRAGAAAVGTYAPHPARCVTHLPSSIVAVPGHYLVYGMLAQIPGANPSSGTGHGYQNAPGRTPERFP